MGEETHRVIRGTDLVAAHPTLLPKAQAQILRANTGETVLPSTKTLGKICEEQLNDFLEANRFSVGPWGETGWQRFVADTAKELADAAQEVAPPYMFRGEDVIAVSKRYRDVLFYCEDKGPTRTVMYCPRHFWALLYKTYLRAPDTFKLERTRVEDAQEAVLKNFPTNIKKLCRWAFANRKNQKMRTLPRGSIIPKGPPKKQYGAARPYVSFAGFFLAKIHRGVGRALAHISLAVAKKHTLEVKNIESACKAMLRFNAKLYLWEQHNADVSFDLQIDNEDLEGFFPSPPHRRLVRDVKRVVAMYKAAFPNVRYILTNVQGVAGRSRAVRERPIPPKFQQGGAQDPVPLDVISSVVQHALEWDLFELGLVVIRQIRGAPIGSNLSPALCMSTVILPEVEFFRSLNYIRPSLVVEDLWEGFRYVDNRMLFSIVLPPGNPLARPVGSVLPTNLATPDFYTQPVNLLREPGLDCGGMTFGVRANRITAKYVVQDFDTIVLSHRQGRNMLPEDFPGRWRFRTIQSAGSHRVLLGGMIARLTAAARQASPTSNKVKGICSLFAVFLLLRTPGSILNEAIRHQAIRFPQAYGPVIPLLRQAIRNDDYRSLVQQAEMLDPRVVVGSVSG